MSFTRGINLSEAGQLDELREKAAIPGLSMAVVENGKFTRHLESGVSSMSSEEKVSEDSIFTACSLSKPVFSYLVFKLIENKILPDDFMQQTFEVANFQFTPEMALSHQTGLPNEWHEPEPPRLAFNKVGEGFCYSGVGYEYLQQVIEEKTGKSLDALAEEHIFGDNALTMKHSSFVRPQRPELVDNHDDIMGVKPAWISNNNNAAGSLHTTASDYALFLQACLNNEKYMQWAFEPKVPDMRMDTGAKDKVDETTIQKINWGLGWGLQKTDEGKRVAFHWGHGPGARAFVAIDLESRSAMVYFTNSDNGLCIARDLAGIDAKNAMDFLSAKLGYQRYDDSEWIRKREEKLTRYDDWQESLQHPWIVENLHRFEGQTGPAKISVDGDSLRFELFGKSCKLVPVSETSFMLAESMNPPVIRLDFDLKSNRVTTYFLDGMVIEDSFEPKKVLRSTAQIIQQTGVPDYKSEASVEKSVEVPASVIQQAEPSQESPEQNPASRITPSGLSH